MLAADRLAQRAAAAAQIFLETERLVLRRFTADDVDHLVELDSDPDVMRFINGGRPTPRHEIESDVLPAFLEYYERFVGYGFWAAIEKSTGRFLGWFHFRPAKGTHSDEIELGYRLRKSAWGKGYATEGSRALIEKGFADLGVRRVFASTMVVNIGSRRVLEKAGLKFVRTFHQPWPDKIEGEEQGDVEYAPAQIGVGAATRRPAARWLKAPTILARVCETPPPFVSTLAGRPACDHQSPRSSEAPRRKAGSS